MISFRTFFPQRSQLNIRTLTKVATAPPEVNPHASRNCKAFYIERRLVALARVLWDIYEEKKENPICEICPPRTDNFIPEGGKCFPLRVFSILPAIANETTRRSLSWGRSGLIAFSNRRKKSSKEMKLVVVPRPRSEKKEVEVKFSESFSLFYLPKLIANFRKTKRGNWSKKEERPNEGGRDKKRIICGSSSDRCPKCTKPDKAGSSHPLESR